MSKRNLFIVGTSMQLITSVHLVNTYQLLADIICLSDHLPNANIYASKLQELDIFKEVIVSDVVNIDTIKFFMYDEIFVVNYAFVEVHGTMLQKIKIQVNIYDEGTLSYINGYLETSYAITGGNCIYLYEPQLSNFYGDKRFIIKQIPKIATHNHTLLQQLNHVFDVDPNEIIVSKDEVLHVFFSQPLQYRLSKKAKIRKRLKLFRSRSNREYALETVGNMQDLIINHLRHMGVPLYRKFHPRETETNIDTNTIQIDYPWELYVLNHPDTKVVQYSLFSSVLTSSFVLGDSYDIKNYFLYPIVVKAIEKYGNVDIINKEVLEFFDKLVKLGKVIPIDSMEELERVCQHEV